MKQKIHPKFNKNCQVKCACGHTFTTGSVKESIYVEICGNCHPFYTGKQKLVDTARRVEKFQAKAAKTQKIKSTQKKTSKTDRKIRQNKKPAAATSNPIASAQAKEV